tara:strand:- start:1821 stop:2234 length:414 start_codon:yes stop_codon:yes gene_type:complete
MNNKLEGLNAGLFKGLIVHRDVWGDQELTPSSFLAILNNGLDTCKPHYFNLSDLTKEIRVEGYNDGEAFVPVEWVANNCSIGDESCIMTVYNDDRWLNSLPKYIHQYLIEWHFNTEGLNPSDYIDASESKVYEPKTV